MTKEEMWFGICSCKGICRREIARIMQVIGEPDALYGKDRKKWIAALTEGAAASGGRPLLTADQGQELLLRTQEDMLLPAMEQMAQRGIKFISMDAPDYPERLRILKDAPFGIYVKGNLPSDAPTCGMVGARACSAYGKAMSERFASTLARAGVQIISGMALGIDGMCSSSAMSAGGRTFVVLGSGVDVIYPRENTTLYYEILMRGGGIISEYPPGTVPLAWQFPHRNRLIAALSDLLLVMEARKQSGTLSTVGYALDLGKDVFALPGRITDPLSESCNQLIREGAGMLTRPEDVLSVLTGKGHEVLSRENEERKMTGPSEPAARRLYQAMEWESKSLEEICRKAEMKAEEAAGTITLLVLDGWAKESAPGYYEKTR